MQTIFTLSLTVNELPLDLTFLNETQFRLIKIGDAWDDYEPGYISERNHFILKIESHDFITDCINGFIKNIYSNYLMVLDKVSDRTISEKSIWLNYNHDVINNKTITFLPDDLILLSKMGAPITIAPHIDYYITNSDDGKHMVAKFEKQICKIDNNDDAASTT